MSEVPANHRNSIRRRAPEWRWAWIFVLSWLAPQWVSAAIDDCRGLYSFSDSLASRWAVQPALEAQGFSPAYASEAVSGAEVSRVLLVPALTSSQSLRLTNWARDNGSGVVGPCNRWTLAMDIKPAFAAGRSWLAILQTDTGNANDAEIFLHSNGSLYAQGTSVPAGTFQAGVWQRLVITCDGDVNNGLTLRFYRNGTLVGTKTGQTFNGAFSIGAKASLFTDDNNETNAFAVSSLGFWTEPLSGAAIAGFGGPAGGAPEFSWQAMPAPSATPGLNREVVFGSFAMTLPASGFALGDGTVSLGPGAASQPGFLLTGTIPVKLLGTTLVYTGTGSYALSNGPSFTLGNLVVTASGVRVGPTGASGAMKVNLPIGMGFTTDPDSRRLENEFELEEVSLATGLRPSVTTVTAGRLGGTRIYLSLEEMPVRYELSQFTWNPSGGSFLCEGPATVAFDRAAQWSMTRFWNAYPGVIGDPRFSNDDHFAFVNGRSGQMILDTAANGQVKIRTLHLTHTTTGAGTGYTTHFPKGLQIRWSTGGSSQLVFENGARQANSYLYEALGTSVEMPREAPGKNCAGVANKVLGIFIPDHWLFTRDYGLRAPVTLNGPQTLEWGAVNATDFAHRINTPQSAGWMMVPGCRLPAAEVAGLDIRQRAAALLLSGVGREADADLAERPATAGYAAGLADYAGLNLRVGAATVESTSRLAGTPVNYSLRNTSKYYIRRSGLTGIHESKDVPRPPGAAYPISAMLAGYPFGLTAIRLSFRDLVNVDSAISGNLNLPEPAGLQDLRFKTLRFGPRGELLSATPETQAPFTLAYWRTEITPQAIHFALPAGTDCPDPGQSTLVLGVTAKLPALSDQAFSGKIGIKNDGHTLTPGDDFSLANGEPITSRLTPPSQMKVKGPGTTTYRFTPIGGGAYLNDSTGALPTPGFVALPGELDVPFFRDMRVILQASAAANAVPGSDLRVHSGDESGFSFWNNDSVADPWNTGMPPLNGQGVRPPPVARRTWIDVVDFKLPATWNPTLRRFSSASPVTDDLLLFRTGQRLGLLGPEVAELNFGVHAGAADLLNFSKLLDAAGADSTLLLQRINTALGGGGLTAPLGNIKLFEQLLGDSLEDALGPALDAAVAPAASTLYADLAGQYAVLNPVAYRNGGGTIATNFTTANQAVGAALSALTSSGGAWPAGVVSRLNGLRSSCESLRAIVRTPSKISAIAGAVLNQGAPPDAAAVLTLAAELDVSLTETIGRIEEAIEQFGGSGALRQQWAASLSGSGPWRDEAMAAVRQMWVTTLDDPAGNYFGVSKQAAFVASFQKAVRVAFLGSGTAKSIRDLFASSLADIGSAARGGFDGVLGASNQLVDLSRTVPESITAALGSSIGSVFGAANLNGYAHVNGDSLTEVRLDGELILKVPTDLRMKAWFILRSVDSNVPGDGALAAAGITNEVAVGAATDFKWFGTGENIAVNAEMRVGFNNEGSPLTVTGGLGLGGVVNVQGIKLIDPQMGVGLGGPNAYLYAKAGAKMALAGVDLTAEAAIFVGKTATLDPLNKVNPEVAKLVSSYNLANGSISGAYVYGYGQFSVLPLLGIPATPLLDIQVGGGSGFYLFYQGGSGDMKTGIQQVYGISGEVLCLVSVSGRLDSYIGINGNIQNPSFDNTIGEGAAIATLKGKLGISPFAVSWSKNFRFETRFGSSLSPKFQTHVKF